MQSRRDHIQAYQFSTSRLVHAVTSGDVGVGEIPFRRARLGTVIGFVLATLIGGGAFVYGLISPVPSTAWKKPGTMIVEKETGTRYLIVGGTLRPTANYASARLLAGPTAPVQVVPHTMLASLQVGSAMGIPGAPDTLPPSLLPAVWALCMKPGGDGRGTSKTVLDLAPWLNGLPAPKNQRMLVSGPAVGGKPGPDYVLWNAVKYPVPDSAALSALGLGNVAPAPVDDLWLAALPMGNELSPAQIASAGSPGPQVAGKDAKVGQLFQVSAAGVDQYYVLRADGLAPVTHTEAALFSMTGGFSAPVNLAPADMAAAPVSPDASLLHRLPDLLSGDVFRGDGQVLCAVQASPGVPPPGTTTNDGGLVVESASALAAGPDVLLPNGQGMVVRLPTVANADPLAPKPPAYLIAGGGMKYFVNGDDALRALGYGGAPTSAMPPSILGLIPSGPELSVAHAQRAVPWGSG